MKTLKIGRQNLAYKNKPHYTRINTGRNFEGTIGLKEPPNTDSLSFTSRVVKVHNGEASEALKKIIDVFEETHGNAKLLGEGIAGWVYKLFDTPYVIKASKIKDSFAHEAQALEKVTEIPDSQHLVARVETEKGNFFLASMFVDGAEAHPRKNPLNALKMKSMLDSFLHLDKDASVYHNDLAIANVLFDNSNQAKVIDFQWAEKFAPENIHINRKELCTPDFLCPSNALMFETAGLPDYLSRNTSANGVEDSRQIIKEYITQKSSYHTERATYLDKLAQSTLGNNKRILGLQAENERIIAEAFKAPSDNVVRLETMKMQFLHSFRQAFCALDDTIENSGNIMTAVPKYLFAAAANRDFLTEIQKLKATETSASTQKYLRLQEQYSKYWEDNFKEWIPGIHGWVMKNLKGESNVLARKFDVPDLNNFGNITSLQPIIGRIKTRLPLPQNYKNQPRYYGIFVEPSQLPENIRKVVYKHKDEEFLTALIKGYDKIVSGINTIEKDFNSLEPYNPFKDMTDTMYTARVAKDLRDKTIPYVRSKYHLDGESARLCDEMKLDSAIIYEKMLNHTDEVYNSLYNSIFYGEESVRNANSQQLIQSENINRLGEIPEHTSTKDIIENICSSLPILKKLFNN